MAEDSAEQEALAREQEAQRRRRTLQDTAEAREAQREKERRAFQERLRRSESELQRARDEENVRAREKHLQASPSCCAQLLPLVGETSLSLETTPTPEALAL